MKKKKKKVSALKPHTHFTHLNLAITLLHCFICLPSQARPSPPKPKKKRLGKNPTVDTSFLPDRDREVMKLSCDCEVLFDWLLLIEMISGGRAQRKGGTETSLGNTAGEDQMLVHLSHSHSLMFSFFHSSFQQQKRYKLHTAIGMVQGIAKMLK